MKVRIAICGLLLALCVTPAFANSLSFKNEGLLPASGVVSSTVTEFSFNGTPIGSGPIGAVSFTLGSITGGSFSGGTFDINLNGFGDVIFANNFSGTISSLGEDLFKLVGTFSGVTDGVHLAGVTVQFFEAEYEDGHLSFEDVHGRTCLTGNGGAAVPEPGTLTMLGTGLIGLAGVIRRKFAA
jgi:hypothetical protein